MMRVYSFLVQKKYNAVRNLDACFFVSCPFSGAVIPLLPLPGTQGLEIPVGAVSEDIMVSWQHIYKEECWVVYVNSFFFFPPISIKRHFNEC